ncbi:MAG TPA: hypothetical protein VJ812_11290 [Gemmatimonadaceae bacterium]|jgi:hypothetical protein|nr:hypothetical protein [Gemmatimonadaceae bacterium]
MDPKQLAKLIRKNAAKAQKVANARDGKAYDETLAITKKPSAEDDESIEREHFFKEMKRREF